MKLSTIILKEEINFEVKGVSFTYTDYGSFYGVYLYDVPKTANVQWKEKLRSTQDAEEWLQSVGITAEVPRGYDEQALDQICSQLKSKGIVCSHDDAMDVS